MTGPIMKYVRHTVACLAVAMFAAGCGGDDGGYDSPLLNEDVPVVDIADLPDIEQTKVQMLDLIERVRAEVVRIVPESEPWRQAYEERRSGCTQESTGRKGVMIHLAKFGSSISFSDEQWTLVYPAVQRLAAEAGLTEVSAMANSSRNHDIRFSSTDGRTLVFGSKEASLLTGSIACRRPAENPPS
ncbi:LppA family lipoprotein [Mycolicibacterium thermoresistibile]